MLASSGVLRASASNRSRSSSTPARRAMRDQMHDGIGRAADREHRGDGVVEGVGVEDVARLEVLPHHLHDALARERGHRAWRESGAGIEAAPGRVKPSASAALVMVEAVPMVMQWPGERAMPCSISCQSFSRDVAGAQLGPVFPGVRARAQRRAAPVAAQHRARGHEDRRQVHADRAHHQRRRGLVAAAHQHRAVGRIGAQQLLGLHRQEVAVHHGGRLLERLGQRHRRHFHREAARLPYAALHFLDALLEVGVAGIDVAPGVDDGDHRLAGVVAAVVTHLRRARAVAEGAHVLGAVPAVAAQLVRSFLFHLRFLCSGVILCAAV